MITVDDQYVLSFSIGSKKDFIVEEDFSRLVLVEEAGNLLPSYQLVFTLRDPTVLPFLNEGSTVDFSFGRIIDDSKLDIPLRILKKSIQKSGKHQYIINLIGLYDSLEYLTDCKIRDFSQKSGIEVINEVVSSYFKPVFNVTSSEDTQIWLQPNVPDKKFVNDVWMHSYIANSFIATAINVKGEFLLKDVVKEAGEKASDPSWRFVLEIEDPKKDLTYDGDFAVGSETGFINQWMGYGREKEIRVVETGEDNIITVEPAPLTALSSKLDRASDTGKRAAKFGLINENVHEKYWDAYLQNLTYLSLFSSTKVGVSFQYGMVPVQVLDLVMFKDEKTEEGGQADEYSGLYFITRVGRSITGRGIATSLEINREALGNIKGTKLK